MNRPKQPLCDQVLWSLTSLNGKAEWTELRIRPKLKAAELDSVLSELAKKDKILIIPREIRGRDRYLIILKTGIKCEIFHSSYVPARLQALSGLHVRQLLVVSANPNS